MEPSSRVVARRGPSSVDQPLFRQEAVAAQQTQWLGTVLLAPSISYKLFALFATITAAAIIAFLTLGDYTRKERVQGWLVPDQGLIRIFAPQASVIKDVSVKDGQRVEQGDPLVILSTELESESLGATQEEVTRRLRSRRDSLIEERRRKDTVHAQTTMSIKSRLAALDTEKDHRDRELEVQRQRVELATANVERLLDLRERGLIAGQRWQQVEDERLDHLARQESLERERAEADQTWLTLKAEQNSLPFNHQIEIAKIDRDIAALEQEIAEAEARRRIVITAPETGLITAVQAKRGDSAQPDVPLVSIIPAGSTLQAQLYLPTRARGFIKPGQRVLLRYQAFPYQKFGHHEGRIARIAQAAIMPDELARRLPASADLLSRAEAGPVYPVTVALSSQTATAYGEAVPLQPGMQLEADVQIETRRLVEWMFEPLYTLTGRMQTGEGDQG
ncbi:MAG: HlyD family efflux transporter periplasmic adaptor subunit [Pseudomonadota bacterium]